jgi:hypothetical protein
MTDLASWASETLTKPWIERLSAIGLAAIVARFKAKQGSADATAGGPHEERRIAYKDFRRAVIEFRTTLSVLSMAPLRLVGALWTLPIHLRAMNRTPAITARILDSFLEVHAVGQKPTIQAAEDVLTALSSAVDAYSATSARRRGHGNKDVSDGLSNVDVALADFALTVRQDLGYGATPETSDDLSTNR